MRAGMRQALLGAGLLLGGLTAAPTSAAAQQGAVGGLVTDESTGGPLEAARVVLAGPNRIETTDREGRFLFRNVAPGTYQVRVLRLGYKPVTADAAVAPGETVDLTVSMTPAPVQLDEIVTTATGEQRKLELGNAVSTIDAARVACHPERSEGSSHPGFDTRREDPSLRSGCQSAGMTRRAGAALPACPRPRLPDRPSPNTPPETTGSDHSPAST